MKISKKVLSIISSVIIISFIVISFYDFGNSYNLKKLESFSSPQEAIEKILKTTDYVCVTQGKTAFVTCDSPVDNRGCQYLIKDGSGWKLVTDYMFDNAYFYKEYDEDGYTLCIREFNGKYMIYLSQKSIHKEDNGKINLTDSINSSFKEFDFFKIFDNHYWYWYLDELPDDYVIYVNGQSVFDKQSLLYRFR